MMIRIKHEGKCRKLSQAVKTIDELKSKIKELFGSEAVKLNITYKDFDGELVSVVDTEDLINCFEEAATLKMSCVTFLLKENGNTSRSISSKKSTPTPKNISESGSSSEDVKNHGFETVEDKKVDAESKQIIEELKKKLIEEHNRALAKLEEETKAKIAQLEDNKIFSQKEENFVKQKKLMAQLRNMNKLCNQESIENPLFVLGDLFKDITKDFPALECNPALLNLVLRDCGETIKTALMASCQKVVVANPEVAKVSETNKAKVAEFREGWMVHCEKRSHGPYGHHGDKEGMERRHHHEHHYEHRHESRYGDRKCRRGEKNVEKDALRAEKQAKKLERESKKANRTEEENALREKVKDLKKQFPNTEKQEIKTIVKQNPTLSAQDLLPLIKNCKTKKSSYK